MRHTAAAIADFLDLQGRRPGSLRISLLPNRGAQRSTLWHDERSTTGSTGPAIEALEGEEYLYEAHGFADIDLLQIAPVELFQPDAVDGRRGRFRPGLATGMVAVEAVSRDRVVGRLEVEVRSVKLGYRSEYRWMLRDIAQQMTELAMRRFAASNLAFMPDECRDAVTIYERFAFLRSLLRSDAFELAIQQVLRRPHVIWHEVEELIRPGQTAKGGSRLIRQLSMPGPRLPWLEGTIRSLPHRVDRGTTQATHDTTPNRFVRFALERWRQVVADIGQALGRLEPTAPVLRGQREVREVLDWLDELLEHELFRELGELRRFPVADQVLHRRDGYREVFRAYIEFELASKLSWGSPSGGYTAGQRDVASLYEHWAFIQIAQLVASLAGQDFDLAHLLAVRQDGLQVALEKGRETIVSGVTERHGRKICLKLAFNRSFSRSENGEGSWTVRMRPDYSLELSSLDDRDIEPIILLFDAKYRIEKILETFGAEEETDDQDGRSVATSPDAGGRARRDDLLKMHAYRDAIRRSAGAYVLYPGFGPELEVAPYRQYDELLPGLGAFVLRPADEGAPIGAGSLRKFIEDVLCHFAQRLTQHERGRFWTREAYATSVVREAESSTLIVEPASGTNVLLGFVKGPQHWAWIHQTKTYNVRASGRPGGLSDAAEQLFCQLLVLYCPATGQLELRRIVSVPVLVDYEAMERAGYPNPRGSYVCVQISREGIIGFAPGLTAAALDNYVLVTSGRRGMPTAVRWGTIMETAEACRQAVRG